MKTIEELENMAQLFWRILLDVGVMDGHMKHYDPLTIEEVKDGYMLHSYIFDYGDGGIHRFRKTLEEVEEWLILSFEEHLKNSIE